jgi:uncharacterized protein YcgI (DUF1989 family)
MPLLMIAPNLEGWPATESVEIGPGEAACVAFDVGQLLTIELLDPGQIAALYAFSDSDRTEYLSPHHTRVFGGSFVLRMGTRMVTNRRRPMFVVGRDSLRVHDLLLPASETTDAAVQRAIAATMGAEPHLPDPVNLFADMRLSTDGRLDPHPAPGRAGDRVTLRALMKGFAVVASARMTTPELHGPPPGRLRVATFNDVLDLPNDMPLRSPG